MPDDASGTRVVLYRGGAEVASWPLERCDRLDLGVVDELARLQLVARGLGFTVRLRNARVELVELFDLAGLAGVVPLAPCAPGSVVEVGGEAEGGEQLGVEEVVVTDDPVA